MGFRADYRERVYAGVLGKIIGVYLGRPFEGWSHQAIMERLGPIEYFVHDRLGQNLIVSDDDITGTFTFLRALEDYGCDPGLTSEQVGQAWLNYLIENRTILWWGGMGVSTEHTAYLRLKNGIPAPASGSMRLNGQVVSEQIGAQIFIDGWGMVCPGDPEKAANFAQVAARVSHDGEAVYGAQVVAAMVAKAFDGPDLEELFETGLSVIPNDCLIRKMVDDVRSWHAKYPVWTDALAQLDSEYGYAKYGGGCHMVPNHGLIWLALLYGQGDFAKSQMIVNTGGWDTDCNAANVGAILGVYGSLQGLDAGPDFRGPVADRLYLPTADAGRCVSDALTESEAIVQMAFKLHGMEYEAPKGGARFHFSQPGSVQGFQVGKERDCVPDSAVENRERAPGQRALYLMFRNLASPHVARATTPTFLPEEARQGGGYATSGSSMVYPGQTLRAVVSACQSNASAIGVRLVAKVAVDSDEDVWLKSTELQLSSAGTENLELELKGVASGVVTEVGIEVSSPEGRVSGAVWLESLQVTGQPSVVFDRHPRGSIWLSQWVQACDAVHAAAPIRIIQNQARGYAITGSRDWTDYEVRTECTPHMAEAFGIAARWQGMRRHVALVWQAGRLILQLYHDWQTVLAETSLEWELDQTQGMVLSVQGRQVVGRAGSAEVHAELPEGVCLDGGIALVSQDGNCFFGPVRVTPL